MAPPALSEKQHTAGHQASASEAKSNGESSIPGDSRESLALDREANRIAERANTIAEIQSGYAFWQIILGALGVGFTGFAAFFAYRATHWAKEAATAARLSAIADNEALKETKAASEAAREDAADQASKMIDQLNIAADTASAMRETALYAAESNQIARESAEGQLRAYITVELKGARIDATGVIEASADIVNRGQTPAKDVTIRWTFAIDEYNPSKSAIDYILSIAHCPSEDVSMMLGPQDTRGINSKADPFLPAEIDRVYSGQASLCVAGIVQYVDAFGKARNTRFVHLYDNRLWTADVGRYGQYGNDYT